MDFELHNINIHSALQWLIENAKSNINTKPGSNNLITVKE